MITLRTQLMPGAFEGNPTSQNISSGDKLRKIQWGSNVFAAANFDVTGNQAVTLPSGTWYDYLNGATPANGTYTLAPGELKVFTGKPVVAPTFADINKRETQGIEQPTSDSSLKGRGEKFLKDGQLLIRRGDNIYTITGARVQ